MDNENNTLKDTQRKNIFAFDEPTILPEVTSWKN